MLGLLAALTSDLDIGRVLIDILIVLAAAKIAGEIAERAGLPSVVGEIIAGTIVGPAVFGWVHGSDVLTVLGELGVVLLLFQVGMEMDVGELRRVGTTSVRVALIGVAAPFLLGIGAGTALGYSTSTAVFLGAGLTATSVGITARVFGDLRFLESREARIVVGAAVADDVLGLVILTVVVKAVSGTSLSPLQIGGVLGLALAFLIAAGVIGGMAAPRLLSGVARLSKTPGTMTAVVFALMLAFSAAATAAQLAPIIGAFMAGIAVGQSHHAERVHRELSGLGHVFVPVFFLSIGIEIDVTALARPKVLGLTALLLVAGVVGKLASAFIGGRRGSANSWDRLAVGLGMIPRGEVGLIFASIGRGAGVLDADLYAALVAVVLLTTLVTPPLLRARVAALTKRASAATRSGHEADLPGGWLTIADERRRLACALTDEAAVIDRLAQAPNSYVVSHSPDELLRHAALAVPALSRSDVRVAVSATSEPERWLIDVALRDRIGLLSVVSGALSQLGIDVRSATIATWNDGTVVDSFIVAAPERPRPAQIARAVESGFALPLVKTPLPGLAVSFDDTRLPWLTECVVLGADVPGLLNAITAAFARSGVLVHDARIDTVDGLATDRFALSDRSGARLDTSARDRVLAELGCSTRPAPAVARV